MRLHKGFNFSIRAIIIVVIGLIAALTVIAFLNDGTSTLGQFSNTTTPEGGFLGQT